MVVVFHALINMWHYLRLIGEKQQKSEKSFKKFVYQQESTTETEKKQWSFLPKACTENSVVPSELE